MLCVSLPAAVATDLGNELFMAAAAVGHTMSSMVEQVASTQGTDSARNMVQPRCTWEEVQRSLGMSMCGRKCSVAWE